MKEDEKENFQAVRQRIGQEGFHYCFESYSSWEEIKDKKFHKLRKQYLESAKLLKEYINQKANQ